MAGLAFLADHLAGTFQLACDALIGSDDLVERIGDLAADAGAVARQAHGEVAVAHSLQGPQQLLQVDIGVVLGNLRRRRAAAAVLAAEFTRGTAAHSFLGFHRKRLRNLSQVVSARMRGRMPGGQPGEHKQALMATQ
jgi:hypothetical protein